MNPDEERMAEALAVERMYGEEGSAFIAERVAILGEAGDVAGVKRWLAIAVRLEMLRNRPEKPN